MSENLHIIHRLIVEVETTDEATGKQVCDEIPRLIKDDILPKLERLFDQWDQSTNSFSFPKVSLDLGSIDHSRLESELESKLLAEMNHLLTNLSTKRDVHQETIGNAGLSAEFADEGEKKEAPVSVLSIKDKMIRAFFYFLEHGTRDWDFPEGVRLDRSLFPAIAEGNPFVKQQLSAIFQDNRQAVERLCLQFEADFIREMVKMLIAPELFQEVLQWESRLTENRILTEGRQAEPGMFWRDIARFIIGNQNVSTSSLQSFLIQHFQSGLSDSPVSFDRKDQHQTYSDIVPIPDAAISANATKQKGEAPESKLNISDRLDGDGIYVQNAGLVLLHPYLESFFNEFDLLEHGDFRNRQDQETAVHLLHYLAVKEVFAPEYDLVFEKYLCGIPVQEPIQRFVALSDAMKTECVQLLTAVIRNWSRLKETSPDGLREGFLRRNGKLTRDAFGRRLIVEHQSHDVLLSFLPWGISVLRMPWMAEVLSVEWSESI